MMKPKYYISLLFLLASFTACEHQDLPLQRPDDYAFITFDALTQRQVTRTNAYEDYDPGRHPGTLGTFGYWDIAQAEALARPVYSNEKVTYGDGKWTCSQKKRWDAFPGAHSFDFFGYMPHEAGASLVRTAEGVYTLSVPFSMPGEGRPVLLPEDIKKVPLLCALPEHKQATTAGGEELAFERVVEFRFDQTLTAFRLFFKLDTKMGAIRQFRLKDVTLKGILATSGTCSRTYTWNGTEWTAGSVQWTYDRQDIAGYALPYQAPLTSSSAYDDVHKTLLLTGNIAGDFHQWGSTFYVIPDVQSQPVLSVTYDVEMLNEAGTAVITRQDVTSTITLNKNNFNNLLTGQTAMIQPIQILIQPRYLYVMADEDAYTGRLLLE